MRLIDADELDKDVIRYADRKHFHGNIEEANIILKTRQVISAAPTIDAEPVRHGRWIPAEIRKSFGTLNGVKCSLCGKEMVVKDNNYCPSCGAKMDGDVDG